MKKILALTTTIARCALLSLPLFAALGCVAAGDSTTLDDSAEGDDSISAPPTGVMQLRHDAPPPRSEAGSTTQDVNSGHGINYHNGSIMSGQVKVMFSTIGSPIIPSPTNPTALFLAWLCIAISY